ncbi:hypothetical protein F1654_07400 [Alkalicaulis satelles]|uniref:Nucleotidyltransferase family protein n=1 Tax=Alkalicaulis satelles TaxID=2609175 RepID=A0A5M6ZFW7_9PROT|nr:GSU2403 family nucleotidyltransferase fold protein [Alkalicaulis satelles]KAA5803619.1 hypothetical protein F1654_07400 [Alkalicaulis satelles]
MIEAVPLAVHTIYQDLLDAWLMQPEAPVEGAPFVREVDGKRYWYANMRINGHVRTRYIGPDTDDVRRRIEALQSSREDRAAFEARCGTMIAQLRAAGLPTLDMQSGKVLSALARAGVFRLGGTLIGTHAFALYAAELGMWVSGRAVPMTEDIDIAAFERLAMVIEDKPDPDLAEALKPLGLKPVPGLEPGQDGARWAARGGGTPIDFLTPSFDDEEGVRALPSLGVRAQSLHFLNFLIADPIPAVGLYRAGVLVRIPRPERFAVHKLIVASRRPAHQRAKARKDLAQARALMEALEETRPQELAAALDTAWRTGPKWRAAIRDSLARSPDLQVMAARHIDMDDA